MIRLNDNDLSSNISLKPQNLNVALSPTQSNVNSTIQEPKPIITINLNTSPVILDASLDLPSESIDCNLGGDEVTLDTNIQANIVLGVKDVKVNGLSVVQNKVAYITIPTKLSEFTDDLDYTRIKVQEHKDLNAIRVNDFIFLKEGN